LHRILFAIALLLLGTVPPILAQQTGQQQQVRILGISVDGNRQGSGTEQSAIISNSGLKVGDAISVPGEDLHKAILRLWALKIFSDIQILIDNKIADGVYLLIRVKEYPRFDHLDINGAGDISQDDIIKKVSLVKGQIVSPEDVNKLVRTVRELYEDEGHLQAEITADTAAADTGKPGYVAIRLKISEGPGVTIDKVHFAGNHAFAEDDLKGELDETKEKVWWHFWSHPKFDKKKFRTDREKLEKFFRKNGYLDAEIVADSEWYSADKRHISVLITVHEGPQYKVRSISWDGNTVYSSDLLSARLQFVPGEIFNQEKFEQNLRGNPDQNDVGSLYLDNGYLKFNLDPEIKRVGADSVDLVIHVYERNQFRIGQVDIKGNKKTYDNVIRRELFTRPGDYFDRSAIIKSLRQLSQLNYFNPEKLRPDTRMVDDKTVDLIYEVEEKSSDNVNASVGYSGAFGFTGALGFTINNFSITEPLSGGAGQMLNFDWQFGEASRFRTFSLGFTEPWLYNTPTTLGVSLFDTRQIWIYDLQQTGLSIRAGRGRLSWLDVYSRLDYSLRMQRNDVHNGGGLYQEGLHTQVSISQTLSRNSTDSPIFPSSGSTVSFTTEISGGAILPGDVSFHKWVFNADWFTPLFSSSKLVLYSSTTFGYLDGFNANPNIPPVELYFMGGTGIGLISTTPLRGYEDRSVGPHNPAGETGGRVLEKQTFEIRLALTLNPIPIYILGFAEGGNVFTDFHHTDFFDLKRSVGLGARLMIQPLGMIGFDYGYGFDNPILPAGTPSGWKFHFQFGRGMQ
jgi:outer membrane protein insertion porin family